MQDVVEKLVEVDITPEQWPQITRSRLAFGLIATHIMVHAPRRLLITQDKMSVEVTEETAHLWQQWKTRLHRQSEKLITIADLLDGSLTQLNEFLEGGWIP
jgi:hypothetical protein